MSRRQDFAAGADNSFHGQAAAVDGDDTSSLPSLRSAATRRTIHSSVDSIASSLTERGEGYASKISPIKSPVSSKISKIFSYTTPLHEYTLNGPRIIADESAMLDDGVTVGSATLEGCTYGSGTYDEECSVATLRSSASIRRLLRTPPGERKRLGDRRLLEEQLDQQRKKAAEVMIDRIRAQEMNTKHVSNFIRHYTKIKMEYASRDRIAREREEEFKMKQQQAIYSQRAAAARATEKRQARLAIGLSTKDLTTRVTKRHPAGGSTTGDRGDGDTVDGPTAAAHSNPNPNDYGGYDDDDDDDDYDDDDGGASIGELSNATNGTADSSASRGALSLASSASGVAQPISEAQLREAYAKYFKQGDASDQFYSLFKKASRDFFVFTADDSLVPQACRSPRQTYLREQTKGGLLPLALLLRGGDHMRGVFLAHRGLGDLRALPLVSVIDSLPAVEEINLRDNRLTDVCLMPLALKLSLLPSLTSLDLSYNKIDQSSQVIQAYIRSEACSLRLLALEGADIDDNECCSLVDALILNKSIQTLSLSKNKIGAAELLNVVMPDVETGGEALARLLLKNSTITSLDVSWNAIRLGSAEQFGAALEFNRGIRKLSVAYNAFGSMGTQMLGRSVKFNRHRLEHIDVSFNALDERACQVLANGAATNRHLRFVNVDGNALGSKGNMALIGAIQRSTHKGKHLVVSFKRCDIEQRDDPMVFDPDSPGGTYELDLSKPYDYMVADEIFVLANCRAGVEIASFEYNKQPVPLERKAVSSSGSGSGKFNIKMYYGYCRLLAKELLGGSIAAASQQLDNVFLMFGLAMDEVKRFDTLQAVKAQWKAKGGRKSDLKSVILFEVFVALFNINDQDGSGTIEISEFLAVLASLGKPDFDPHRLRLLMMEYDNDDSGSVDEQEFALIMVNQFCSTALPRGAVVEKASGRPHRLLRSGRCRIVVRYECSLPSRFDLGDDTGFLSIIHSIEVAETEHEKLGIFRQAISSPYFYFDARQAQLLLEHTRAFALKKEEVVAAIVPQIVSAEQCLLFVNGNLGEDEKFKLRIFMGAPLGVFLGCPTGHYLFNLANRADVAAGKKLAAVSATERAFTSAAGVDTSMKGNGQNFRNEHLFRVSPGSYPDLSGHWFARPPRAGMLRTDYVSTTRPLQGTAPMSAKRFETFLARLDLEEVKACTNKLRDVATASQAMCDLAVDPPLTVVHVKEYFFEYMDSCHHFLDVFPLERELFVSGCCTPRALQNERKPNPQYIHPLFPLLYKKLLLFQLMVPSTYFSVQQLLQLLRLLPSFDGCAYIRVQMLQSCLGAIVDLENLHIALDGMFTVDERNEAVHRMGLLNLYDPMHAERVYRLDLRKHDNRDMAKLLIQLSIREPGDNFKNAEFRWTRYDERIPGWSVPAPWTTRDESSGGEGGPRHHGWFSFEYQTFDEGGSEHVDIGARKELRRLTLAGLKRTL